MSLLFTTKQVLSEHPDGFVVSDTKTFLVPRHKYDQKLVLTLLNVEQNGHIPDFKTVMQNFNVEVVRNFEIEC